VLNLLPSGERIKRGVNYSRANLRIFGWASELAESQEEKSKEIWGVKRTLPLNNEGGTPFGLNQLNC
jgi:hypothetical protein